MSRTIAPSQGAAADASSLREVRLEEEAIQCIEESNKARDKENPRREGPTLEKGQNEKVADNSEKTRQDKASDALNANNASQYVTLVDVAKLIERKSSS
nr:hypothetical protein CFP56_59005 [Quercus suber]